MRRVQANVEQWVQVAQRPCMCMGNLQCARVHHAGVMLLCRASNLSGPFRVEVSSGCRADGSAAK